MKNILSIILILAFTFSISAQINELNPFTEKAIKAFFSKDTKSLKSLIISTSDLEKVATELDLDKEDIDEYEKEEYANLDIVSDEEFFWEEYEDVIFYKEEKFLQKLNLDDFEIINAVITDVDQEGSILSEITIDVFIRSNKHAFHYQLSELVFSKAFGFKFYDEPTLELETDDFCNEATGGYFEKDIYQKDSGVFLDAFLNKKLDLLKSYKKNESKYLTGDLGTAQGDLDKFWVELSELGIGSVKDYMVLTSVGGVLFDEGKKDELGIYSWVKIGKHVILFEIGASYYDGDKLNFDSIFIESSFKL